MSFKKFRHLAVMYFDEQFRRAKTKLPKDIKNQVEEWKFSSGALVMCLVAYPDGEDVQSFQ